MAFDPSDDEAQELFRDGWYTVMGGDFQKATPEGIFWMGIPSGSRNRKYNVEWKSENARAQLGSATTLQGALRLVKKKQRDLSRPLSARPIMRRPGLAKPKRRVGRTMVSIDWLQEKLDDEVLRGASITLDGEAYSVGNFIGDKVELWRE